MTTHEQSPDIPNWGGTTDPTLHDPQQYRYLVHAINPFSSMNALVITLYDAKDGIEYDESWGDQKISMYEQPERIGERVSLSMSLIDQDHTATWGEAGLIVEAPEQNVVLTSSSDAGAHNNNLDFLLKQAQNHGVMSGDYLLSGTSPYGYNEVVAVANRDGQRVQLKGFFYKETEAGEPYNKQLARRMQAHASRLGLPVVAITEQGRYAQDKVDIVDGKLSVQFNGNRYLLSGFEPQHQFKSYDERGYARFIAPHEVEPVLSYAVSTGNMSEEETAKIAAEYAEVDKQRQTPKVEFDEDGTVKKITYFTGYGIDESKVSIGKSGHGYRTNLAKQSEEMQEAMLGMGRMQMIGINDDRSYVPISPAEADKMVDTACKTLDDEKADTVHKWYREHREVLEKQWGYHMESRRSFGSLSLSSLFEHEDWGNTKLHLLTPSGNSNTSLSTTHYEIKTSASIDDIISAIKIPPKKS